MTTDQASLRFSQGPPNLALLKREGGSLSKPHGIHQKNEVVSPFQGGVGDADKEKVKADKRTKSSRDNFDVGMMLLERGSAALQAFFYALLVRFEK